MRSLRCVHMPFTVVIQGYFKSLLSKIIYIPAAQTNTVVLFCSFSPVGNCRQFPRVIANLTCHSHNVTHMHTTSLSTLLITFRYVGSSEKNITKLFIKSLTSRPYDANSSGGKAR